MGSHVGQIFRTASLHRDHSILYVLVCEKEESCTVAEEEDEEEHEKSKLV